MTTPTTTRGSSLTHDLLYAARYFLWRPRVLLLLAAIAIVAGLALNWSWLVAAGLAPVLISTLPCLIMCGFGVCMLCRNRRTEAASTHGAAEAASPPTMLAVAATDEPSTGRSSSTSTLPSIDAAAPPQPFDANPAVGVASCCQGSMNETKAEEAIDLQPNRQRKDTNA